MSEFKEDLKNTLAAWKGFICYLVGHKTYFTEWKEASITSTKTHYREKICKRCGDEWHESGYFDSKKGKQDE